MFLFFLSVTCLKPTEGESWPNTNGPKNTVQHCSGVRANVWRPWQHGYKMAFCKTHMYLSSDSLLTKTSLILSIFKSSPSMSSTVMVESAMETTSSSSEGQREGERDRETSSLCMTGRCRFLSFSKGPRPNDICSLGDGWLCSECCANPSSVRSEFFFFCKRNVSYLLRSLFVCAGLQTGLNQLLSEVQRSGWSLQLPPAHRRPAPCRTQST